MEWILITDENRHLYAHCEVRSSGSKQAMICELPPRHWVVPFGAEGARVIDPYHRGRNRCGHWRSWKLTEEEQREHEGRVGRPNEGL